MHWKEKKLAFMNCALHPLVDETLGLVAIASSDPSGMLVAILWDVDLMIIYKINIVLHCRGREMKEGGDGLRGQGRREDKTRGEGRGVSCTAAQVPCS